ncbi:MAG: site-specific integrase [Solirubrobacterales bacterium]
MPTKKPRRVRVKTGIYKAKDAAGKDRFEIFYRDEEGKPHWKRVPGGIRSAETARADILARKGRGEKVRPVRVTFNEAADAWWEAQASALSLNTQNAYRASLNRLRKVWGDRKLDNIGPDTVAALVREMQAEGRRSWTIKGALTVVGRVFDYSARRLGWHGSNPVRELEASERPSDDQPERVNFSRDQLRAVLRAAAASDVCDLHNANEDEEFGPDPLGYSLIFRTASRTGLRLGEVLGIKWGKIDWTAGTIAIDHQLDRRGGYVRLKSKRSRRTIVVPARLLAKLRAHKLASLKSADENYVFLSRDQTPWDHRNIAGRSLRLAMRDACDDEGNLCWPELSDPDADIDSDKLPTFHSFRHTFAAAWIANGGDLVELSRHLGHSNPAITASVYAGEFEAAARAEERRKLIGSMFRGEPGSGGGVGRLHAVK